MNKILGIYVTSDQHLDKLIKLCRAAKKMKVEVRVFLTHQGTRLSTDTRIEELRELAEIAICAVGFDSNNLNKNDSLLDDKSFSSQSWHAEMVYDCDRYLTF